MSEHFKDYYKILETSFSEDIQVIKKSYRRLALKYHPDVCKEVYATQKFLEIQEAWEILSNKTSRVNYNLVYEYYYSSFKPIQVIKDELGFDKVQQEYKHNKERAQNQAIIKSKLTFKAFAESIGEVIAKSVDVLTSVYAIVVGGIFLVGIIYSIVNLNFVVIGIALVFGILVGLGYYVHRKELREEKEKLGW